MPDHETRLAEIERVLVAERSRVDARIDELAKQTERIGGSLAEAVRNMNQVTETARKIEIDYQKMRSTMHDISDAMQPIMLQQPKQTQMITEVRDAILGSLDDPNPGMRQTIKEVCDWKMKLEKRIENVTAWFLKPICGLLAVAIILAIAYVAMKGWRP